MIVNQKYKRNRKMLNQINSVSPSFKSLTIKDADIPSDKECIYIQRHFQNDSYSMGKDQFTIKNKEQSNEIIAAIQLISKKIPFLYKPENK